MTLPTCALGRSGPEITVLGSGLCSALPKALQNELQFSRLL
jgi:hypothetical protein